MKAATATTHVTHRSSRREAARPTAIQQGSLACGGATRQARAPGLALARAALAHFMRPLSRPRRACATVLGQAETNGGLPAGQKALESQPAARGVARHPPDSFWPIGRSGKALMAPGDRTGARA